MESVKPQAKSTKRTKSTSNPKSAKRKLSVISNPSKSESARNEKERNVRISVSAYYKAQARGFEPGYELADWLAAEAEES